jgi:hypothetical protein
LLLTFHCLLPNAVNAQDWSELPEWSVRPKVLGHETAIVLKPKFRIFSGENSLHKLKIDINANISDALAKVPAMLQDVARKKSEKCGTRWSFPELAPLTVGNGNIRLAGTIRARQYACALGTKAKLAQITGDFVVMLAPVWTSERLGLKAELKQFKLNNDAASDVGLEDELNEGLQLLLDRVIEGAAVKIPSDIQVLRPVIDAATFIDNEKQIYLSAKAHIFLTPAQFQELLAAFVRASSKD